MRDLFTPKQLTDFVIGEVNNVPGLNVEYYEIVDGNTLQLISSWEGHVPSVGCIAVFCGGVRLIDNIRYN
jgi:pantoate--beta-alanine ligase